MKNVILIEGINGSGKSTVVHEIARILDERNVAFRQFTDPGISPAHPEFKLLRDICRHASWRSPVSSLLAFSLARAELTAQIRETLSQGQVVLLDRYHLSTMVYQTEQFVRLRGMELSDAFEQVYKYIEMGDPVRPDLTVVLDVDVHESRRRAEAAAGGKLDQFERLPVEIRSEHVRLYRFLAETPAMTKIAFPLIGKDIHRYDTTNLPAATIAAKIAETIL